MSWKKAQQRNVVKPTTLASGQVVDFKCQSKVSKWKLSNVAFIQALEIIMLPTWPVPRRIARPLNSTSDCLLQTVATILLVSKLVKGLATSKSGLVECRLGSSQGLTTAKHANKGVYYLTWCVYEHSIYAIRAQWPLIHLFNRRIMLKSSFLTRT